MEFGQVVNKYGAEIRDFANKLRDTVVLFPSDGAMHGGAPGGLRLGLLI